MPTAGRITNLLAFSIFSTKIRIWMDFILELKFADVEFWYAVSRVVKFGESTFD